MTEDEKYCNFYIEIAACKEPMNYVVQVNVPGLNPCHYACGPNNSISKLIGSICSELEFKNHKDKGK